MLSKIPQREISLDNPIQNEEKPLGRRVSKATDENKTVLKWDGDLILSDDTVKHGVREFVYYPGTSEPLAFIDKKKQVYYYQNNISGLPEEITNEFGRTVWSASYGSFGDIEELHKNQIDNPIRF